MENYKKAGEISVEAKKYAKQIINPGMSLLDIAEKIEGKIKELGGELAFPVNLGINEIAAHYTPGSDDEAEAYGLLKIDIGVHVKGAIADTAFSLDLSKDGEYKNLVEASEKAVEEAINSIKKDTTLSDIGLAIQRAIAASGFSPIRNLSGHKLDFYAVHAGLTIPNYENNNQTKIEDGAYAIEPFSTTGQGIVYDGGKSGIYRLEKEGSVRDPSAKKMLDYIKENYSTLPFCERWLTKQFGSRTRLSLMFLEKAGIIQQYSQLIEKSHAPVSQAEHTIIIEKGKVKVTTK
ncbi:type II methionyl aminopeptidase [Candidatus Pacearchaeota archaeon RBG_13_36_9]|nr:MAG: type II methionyl aminopeptidase [Candidatus Pacearchaeota archaeon RBG_13_36_9]